MIIIRILRKISLNKDVLIAISNISPDIKIESMKSISEELWEICIFIEDKAIADNYSIWDSIMEINDMCVSSLHGNYIKGSKFTPNNRIITKGGA